MRLRNGKRYPSGMMGPQRFLAFVFAVAIGSWSSGGLAQYPEETEGSPPPPASDDSGVRYAVAFTGDAPKALIRFLERASVLNARRDRPPPSLGRLRARAEEDLTRLRRALRSEGYYAGDIAYRIRTEDPEAKVEIQVTAGPRYRIARSTVRYRGDAGDVGGLPADLGKLGLAIGAPARSADVIAAEESLIGVLKNSSRPFARPVGRDITVSHRSRSMEVIIEVDAGPRANFGPVTFLGVKDVSEKYLRIFVPWTPGDPFAQQQVDLLASRLRGTGLFATVSVDPAAQTDSAGRLPIAVSVTEGKRRSIGLGAEYSTAEGVNAEVFWEHRNLFGRAERLRATVTGGELRQELRIDFQLPNFRRLDQDLVSNTRIERQDTDAFREIGISESVRIERQLTRRWRVGGGGSLDFIRVDDGETTRRFALAGLPAFAFRDSRDDRLNPSRGGTLRFDVTPYKTFVDESGSFVRSEILATLYRRLTDDRRVIVAGRARFGSIVGSETEEIPATKRFYAGGSGSIRGFQFQHVGPLDDDNEPIGGRSRIEAGLEMRFRVYGPVGFVAFVEGGSAFDDIVPDFGEPIRVGAGGGLRYFTAIGPLRLDVAFPVNRRAGIDDAFQIYISFGQAF